jgi:hypothetical protein
VTGASSGLGLETALVLAQRGSAVVLACRDVAKAERAAEHIRSCAGQAAVRVVHLDARLRAAGASTAALAAHPGNSRTQLWRWTPRLTQALYKPRLRMLTFWFAQSAQMGALPTLRAAADPAARGGGYYGPPGRRQSTGYPVRVESSARSHDKAAQRRLWAVSQGLTGVSYRIPVSSG